MTKPLYRAPGLLSTEEAARVAGVDPDTVTRWRMQGLLVAAPAPGGSRLRLFAREDIERIAAERGSSPMPRRRRGLNLVDADENLRRRFWSKVNATGDCWTWQRHCTEAGYGQFTLRKGDFRLAHVVSFALTRGPVAPGLNVCHHCDNPPCVRPEHLFLGPQSANVEDMFAKGRQGSRHPGTERANARLSDDEVRAIRAIPPYFGRNTELARQYGVSTTTIRKIIARQKWRHVA